MKIRPAFFVFFSLIVLAIPGLAAADDHADCIHCSIMAKYGPVKEQADVAKAKIENGVVVYYSSADPELVEKLHEMAQAQAKMIEEIGSLEEPEIAQKLCKMCQGHVAHMAEATVKVSPSENGFFLVMMSEDDETVAYIQESFSN